MQSEDILKSVGLTIKMQEIHTVWPFIIAPTPTNRPSLLHSDSIYI